MCIDHLIYAAKSSSLYSLRFLP
uniref:Uncharacterized protein n=1 Tax=Arundo donax TaxID=35708 RepID=A0A0A8ZR81_ARUDO